MVDDYSKIDCGAQYTTVTSVSWAIWRGKIGNMSLASWFFDESH